MKNRLFIALDIPEDVIEVIIDLRNKIYGDYSRINWEPKEKLHITMKFLGDVDESSTTSIINAIEEIGRNFGPIKCSFNKFGIFYKDRMPRILWLGTTYNEQLVKMYETINDEMFKLGFEKEERKFKSHLTILRVKEYNNNRNIEKFKDAVFDEINFVSDKLSLIKSELEPAGSVYTIVKKIIMKKSEE
ncbi:MAG: RNA 2',3'-cyclic phosphodiesterase [Ignavibacteriae bacterium HGW-Ignavibacteriae-2]|jgi:2'-5' RNA ligase|nr:MAG: RNA 2',3'-cyclic phosphodiesterase [Ignavibacteriae bacterium HGW-Ignavibacteriae-2]